MKNFVKTRGLIVAPLTPMNSGGSIHYEKVAEQAELFRRNNIVGVFICGTTGESMSLTIEERQRMAEVWKEVIDPNLKLIVHVGHDCLTYAKTLSHHAESIGADAVAALAPIFYKPNSLDALTHWFSDLASCTNLPFYYYNIPSVTGVNMPVREFLEKMQHLPNLAGVKFTHENLFDFGRCLECANGEYDILFGRDEMLLCGLALGATGAVGSFYNFAAPLFCRIIDAFNAGDLSHAQKLQGTARQLARIYFDHGATIATAKAMMKIAGLDCGPVRLPILELSSGQINSLEDELEKIHFENFCMT